MALVIRMNTKQCQVFIADKGLEKAVTESRAVATGVNTYDGAITCPGVAEAFDMDCQSVRELV